MSIAKKVSLIILALVLGVLCLMTAMVSMAYFTNKEIYDGYLSGEIELLFDRLDITGYNAYQKTLNAEHADVTTIPTEDQQAWGSKNYPYVISNIRHLYNLSELQRLGYFDKKFIKTNTGTNFSNIPYFLVCTPDYKPVTVDGSNYTRPIRPIGTESYPFIGSVKGVTSKPQTEGDVTNLYTTIGDKTSDTSVISNVTIVSESDNVDVGLFGYVGYLGTVPTAGTGTFAGQVSTISNLLLSDVSVKVDSSLFSNIVTFVEDHIFSFTPLFGTDNYSNVPHENHHIGILAGHVAYSQVEFISVYYSSDDKVAIDLKDSRKNDKNTPTNYMSATGIIGFMDNLNPDFTTDANGNAQITAGSGDSMGDLSYGSIGGGGGLSGIKAGYVLAKNIYETYGYTKTDNTVSQIQNGESINLIDAVDENGNPLCQEWVRDRILLGYLGFTQNTGRYYFYDGVFTFAVSTAKEDTKQDLIESTWKYQLDANGKPVLDADGKPVLDIDNFYIGENSDSAWVKDTSSGNKTAVGYVRKVENINDLNAAIDGGKKIFIGKENGSTLNLINLYNQSQPNSSASSFAEKYTTGGGSVSFASDTFIDDEIRQLYVNRELKLPKEFANDPDNPTETEINKFIAALKDSKNPLKAINLGTDSTDVDITTLQNQFQITATPQSEFKYFIGQTPVNITSDNKFQDYYTYDVRPLQGTETVGTLNTGYFYFEVTGNALNPTYTHHWVGYNAKGEIEDKNLGVGNPYNFYYPQLTQDIQSPLGQWQGVNIFRKTVDNVEYTGVVVNATNKKFLKYTEPVWVVVTTVYNPVYYDETASFSGINLTKPVDTTYDYFYRNLSTGYYYHSTDTSTAYELTNLVDTLTDTAASEKDIYKTPDGSKTGILVDRYSTFSFRSASPLSDENGNLIYNYMRIVQADFGWFGTYHVLWNGTNTGAETKSNFKHTFLLSEREPTVTNNTNAVLFFNPDGTCYIQYSIGDTGLYVNSNGTSFNTATSNEQVNTKLNVYVVENIYDVKYGRITFRPSNPENPTDLIVTTNPNGYELPTNEYLLYATSTHTKSGNVINSTTTSYEVLKVEDLGTDAEGKQVPWNNGVGNKLTSNDLTKKFKMQKGITFGATITLLGGELGTSGMLTAPVGSNGVSANIPSACVAFRINKQAPNIKIRVILATARSEYYIGEKDGEKLLYDLGYIDDNGNIINYKRYFNLWKMEAAGESILNVFNAQGDDRLIDRFEVPRSHPYEPGKTPSDTNSEHISVKYNNGTNTGTYRCYLNGNRILLAYEFTLDTTQANTPPGVYCMGMSGIIPGENGAQDTVVSDVPMEIVYFSADGVASAGRDGLSGSQLGTIDFVYDYQGKIVTVTESSELVNNNEDYNNYYPSYVLAYTDNGMTETVNGNEQYININQEILKIRRYVVDTLPENPSSTGYNKTQSLAIIEFTVYEGDKIKVIQYAVVADNVKKENEPRPTPTTQ